METEAALPAGFSIAVLKSSQSAELAQLVRLFALVFEEENPAAVDETHLESLLRNPQFLAVAAYDAAGSAIGGLTAYILPRYRSRDAEAFIYDVAVHPGHQRKGIGLQLLRCLREHCAGAGIRTSFVPAHEEDAHALDFYRKAGGEEERVRLFVFRNG